MEKAANFKAYKADDKWIATKIMDRFQEEREDQEQQKALTKLLIETIGELTMFGNYFFTYSCHTPITHFRFNDA